MVKHNLQINLTIDGFSHPGKLILIGIFLFSQLSVFAQTKIKTGKVTTADGKPLPGVTIFIKGTSQATFSNTDGNFSIPVIPENSILVFSFLGMKTQEIIPDDHSYLNITMVTDALGLDDQVSIGYGIAPYKNINGSVANVKARDFKHYAAANVQELLRSSVPGLQVGYSTNAKNSPDMEIRGHITFHPDKEYDKPTNHPLIVLNGVIFKGDISEINVNDVETVSVLKDAGASSIFGSRGANGVLLISTKRGAFGKAKIQVSAKYGIVRNGVRNETMKGEEMLSWMVDKHNTIIGNNEGSWSVYDDPRKLSGSDLNDWKAANGIPGESNQKTINTKWLQNLGLTSDEIFHFNKGREYDWQDFLFQTGERHDYHLSVSGQNERASYYWSMGLMDNESLKFRESFKSLTSHLNVNIKVTNFLSTGLSTNFAYQDDGDRPFHNGAYRTASPYDTPWEAWVWYDENVPQTGKGMHTYSREFLKRALSGSSSSSNDFSSAYFSRKYDRFSILPTLFAKATLPFGITVETRMSTYLQFIKRFEFEESENPIWGHGGNVRRQHNQSFKWQWDNILQWKKDFDKHRIYFTGLLNAERDKSFYTDARNSNLQPTEALGYHGIGYGIYPITHSYDYALTRTALMGRVNYAFSNRYSISASVRRDGYSGFGENSVFASFPSFSAAWTISNESFMANKPYWMEYLKLRASWGVSGNSNKISAYTGYANFNGNNYLNWSGDYFQAYRLSIERTANTNLTCEKNSGTNLGLDYGIFNSRVRGSFDIYSSKTNGILLNKKLPVLTGVQEITSNVGSLKNSGFELSINTVNTINSDFGWTSSLNLSFNTNEILSLTGDESEMNNKNGWFIGQSKDIIWNFETGDVYGTHEAVEAEKWGLEPGDFRITDQNGDGVLTTKDKVFQGSTINPWYITFRNDLTWKNFDMGLIFLSKLGFKAGSSLPFNQDQSYFKSHNWYKSIDYWMPDKQIKNFARINSIRLNSDMQVYVPKDYIRLQNLSLGYNIPVDLLKSVKASRARVAFNADNLFVITSWYQGDPESNLGLSRVFYFSIDFSF